jgi:hypothetical protein
MDSKQIFDMILNVFSNNGLTIGENNIRVKNKAKWSMVAGGESFRFVFDSPYPIVTASKSFKVWGKTVFKPSFSRSLTALHFTSNTVTVELDNSPDFTFDY